MGEGGFNLSDLSGCRKEAPALSTPLGLESFLLLFNFLLAGQVLLNIKVSTIGGNYTVSCFN